MEGFDCAAAGKGDQLLPPENCDFRTLHSPYNCRIGKATARCEKIRQTRYGDYLSFAYRCRLSMIECKGYKIRTSLKKEEQHDGDDDHTIPTQKIFFP